jgi:hypothetical protein
MNKTEYSINKQKEKWTVYKIYICGDHPINDSQGELNENLHASQGGLLRSSPLRTNGSLKSQVGRLSCMGGGQRQFKVGHQARVNSDQMVLMRVRRGGWTMWAVAKGHLNLAKSHRELLGSSLLSSNGSHGIKAGRLNPINDGQRRSNESWKQL